MFCYVQACEFKRTNHMVCMARPWVRVRLRPPGLRLRERLLELLRLRDLLRDLLRELLRELLRLRDRRLRGLGARCLRMCCTSR